MLVSVLSVQFITQYMKQRRHPKKNAPTLEKDNRSKKLITTLMVFSYVLITSLCYASPMRECKLSGGNTIAANHNLQNIANK